MSRQNYETTFLVVGGGIAGVSCIETLAFHFKGEKILLLTESPLIKAVTNLVALGKSLSRFDIEEKHVSTLPVNVQVVTDQLMSIYSKMQYVKTEKGAEIYYKYLCLCTGGRPKLIDQAEGNEFVLGIRDTESVIEFQNRIKNSRKIAIVGNGGIASELIYELKGILIDWVIKDKYVSQTFVDPGASAFFQSRIENKGSETESVKRNVVKRMRYQEGSGASEATAKSGAALGPDWHTLFDLTGSVRQIPKAVKIHYGTVVKEITRISKNENDGSDTEFPLRIALNNGDVIDCDFLVSATGVNPAINFSITDNTFKMGPDGGIFVNELMETSVGSVYAAGDVCYAGWEWAPQWFQMRLWTQARQMGAMAGKAMAAHFKDQEVTQDFCFELFGHVTQLFGYQVVLLGKYNGQGLDNKYEALVRTTRDMEYIKYVLKDGRLQGAILIGDTELEETAENLISNQLDLTPYGDDILNPDIDIEDFFD